MGWIFVIAGGLLFLFTTIKGNSRNERGMRAEQFYARHKVKVRILAGILAIFGLFLFIPKTDQPPQRPGPSAQVVSKPDQNKPLPAEPVAEIKEFIRKLSPNIREVSLNQLYNTEGYKTNDVRAEIRIAQDPFMGGGSDWNSISSDVFRLTRELFKKPEIVRIRYIFFSPDNKDFEWAYVPVDRAKLPTDWEASYHFLFSTLKPDAGSVQSQQWLCAYYKDYKSARPHGEIPEFCKRLEN